MGDDGLRSGEGEGGDPEGSEVLVSGGDEVVSSGSDSSDEFWAVGNDEATYQRAKDEGQPVEDWRTADGEEQDGPDSW